MVTVDNSQVFDEDNPVQVGTQAALVELPTVQIQGMEELLRLLAMIEFHLSMGSGIQEEE